MKTILVVEDDGAIRELIRLQLTAAGYERPGGSQGDLGARLGVSSDLILLDWMMPKMTGVDICRPCASIP